MANNDSRAAIIQQMTCYLSEGTDIYEVPDGLEIGQY